MKSLVRMALLAAVAVSLLLLSSDSSLGQKKYKVMELVDQPAPAFKGELLDGKAAALDDYKGKVVLVDFWAVWCGPCIATFPHLRDWQDKYGDKGLVIVGATRYYKNYSFADGKLGRAATPLSAAEERDMLKDFVGHHKLKHPILALPADAFQTYKIEGIPSAVVIDRKGVIRLARVGSGDANAKIIEAKIEELLKEK